jgi:hypothetical protein
MIGSKSSKDAIPFFAAFPGLKWKKRRGPLGCEFGRRRNDAWWNPLWKSSDFNFVLARSGVNFSN